VAVIRCDEIMKRKVEAVRPKDSVHSAARLMRDRDVGILPVCDERDRVVGAITDRDITVRVCAENLGAASTRVGDVMTREVIACHPWHPLGHVEALMAKHQCSRVFVTDESGVLCGIVSLSDIVQFENPKRIASTMFDIAARKYRPESP
jgi:CBS domain-containing protein